MVELRTEKIANSAGYIVITELLSKRGPLNAANVSVWFINRLRWINKSYICILISIGSRFCGLHLINCKKNDEDICLWYGIENYWMIITIFKFNFNFKSTLSPHETLYLNCTGNNIVGMRHVKKTCLYIARRGLQEHNRSSCGNGGWRSQTGLMDPHTTLYN